MTDELIWGGLGNLRFLQVKTDISKTSCFTFGGNKKLELDRPLPKKWSFRDKAISSFDHSDKHETRRIVRLLSIKQHII